MTKKRSDRNSKRTVVSNRNVRPRPNPRLPLKRLQLAGLDAITSPFHPLDHHRWVEQLPRRVISTRLTKAAKARAVASAGFVMPGPRSFPSVAAFAVPQGKRKKQSRNLCGARHERREIMFAYGRVGKGSGNSKRREFGAQSKERC